MSDAEVQAKQGEVSDPEKAQNPAPGGAVESPQATNSRTITMLKWLNFEFNASKLKMRNNIYVMIEMNAVKQLNISNTSPTKKMVHLLI